MLDHTTLHTGHPLYDIGGLRMWRQDDLRLRRRIAEALVDCAQAHLRAANPAWCLEEIEAPTMMPVSAMSGEYTSNEVFMLQDAPAGTAQWAMRPETTDGSYRAAAHIMRTTKIKPPLCVWQMGTSYRRERSDGATAEKLRFNAFTQLEMQCIYREDTAYDFTASLRTALADEVARLTGRLATTIQSDRLPAYSTSTVDIMCAGLGDSWFEIASTSQRTDFPQVPGYPPMKVFEIAFGMDRLVALTTRAKHAAIR